jgi:hypothetical protein
MNSNFKRKLLAGLFAPVLGLTVGSAFAQTTTPAAGTQSGATAQGSTSMSGSASTMWNAQHFDRIDKNRDGRISKEEAEADAAMKGAWSKLDASNRGSVSREDFDKYARTLNPNTGGNPMGSNVPSQGTTK